MEQQQMRLHHQQTYRAGTQASLSNGSNNDVEHMPLYHRPFGTPNSDRHDLASVTTGGGVINYSRTSDDLNSQCAHTNHNGINDLNAEDNKNQLIAHNASRNGDCSLNINLNASHSDQQFRYGLNKSNSNLSVPKSCDVIPNARSISSDRTKTAAHGYESSSCSNNSTNGNAQYSRRSIDSGGTSDLTGTMAAGTETMTANLYRESKDLAESNANKDKQELSSSMRQQILSGNFSEESPVNAEVLKKYGTMRSYINSITGSAVSSLANIGSPNSPPQATSPTGEVKELLEKIRQLQESAGNSRDDELDLQRQSDATTFSNDSTDAYDGDESSSSNVFIAMHSTKKRPSTLQQNRRTNHRTRFFPMSAAKNLRSPIGSTSILGFGRGRKGWISKSAPTTPGTAVPSCFLDDDSPLLNEHDEDADQNAWMHGDDNVRRYKHDELLKLHEQITLKMEEGKLTLFAPHA